MEAKKFTQYGTFTIVILGAVTLLFAVILITSVHTRDQGTAFFIGFFILCLITLLLFYKLTIFIDQTSISFKMGIGLIGKTYKVSDILSCTPVRNSLFMGIGIRWIGKGWLYNVSGFKAVELRFNNKKSVVRIGTDRPEEISALMQELIGANIVSEQSIIREESVITPYRILLIIAALVIFGVILYNNGENNYEIKSDSFIIHGWHGITIPKDKIAGIDTISNLPSMLTKISGYDDFWTKRGTYNLGDQGEVRLFIKTGHSPYLRIWVKNGVPVYLNFRDREKTIKVYRELLKSFGK